MSVMSDDLLRFADYIEELEHARAQMHENGGKIRCGECSLLFAYYLVDWDSRTKQYVCAKCQSEPEDAAVMQTEAVPA